MRCDGYCRHVLVITPVGPVQHVPLGEVTLLAQVQDHSLDELAGDTIIQSPPSPSPSAKPDS